MTGGDSGRCRDVARAFAAWLSLSRDTELLALLAQVQRALCERGYHVEIEIGRDRPTVS